MCLLKQGLGGRAISQRTKPVCPPAQAYKAQCRFASCMGQFGQPGIKPPQQENWAPH